MSCSNCKKKKEAQKQLQLDMKKDSSSKFDTWVNILIVVWFFLGIYGLVKLIKDIINLL